MYVVGFAAFQVSLSYSAPQIFCPIPCQTIIISSNRISKVEIYVNTIARLKISEVE
jgi:hypothetical protein